MVIQTPSPAAQVIIGGCLSVMAFAAFCLLFGGCASSQEVIRCESAALRKLPEDPFAITPEDVSNLVARLHECKNPSADAGK